MKRNAVFVIMLTLSLLFCGCADSGEASSSPSDVSAEVSDTSPGPFETVFRFVVSSDNHISTVTDASAVRLGKLFESAYRYASGQEYKKIDAAVFVGDITNYGYAHEYDAWKKIVNDNIKDETELITVMGNHEYYCNLSNLSVGEKLYSENIDDELNKHVVVNGYHFVGISTYGEGDYTEDIDWLSQEMEKAAQESGDKPIVTFQHHHIKDTVYVSSEWYTPQSAELDAIYSKYSNVLNFSGHSHGPINNPTSVYQKDYTLFGTGTLSYFEMTSGMTYGTIPPNANNAAQYYIVEFSADNRVRVLPYNLITDDFFKTPDGSEQLVYAIDNLKDKSTWEYTEERAEKSQNPVFADSAEITVGEVTTVTAEITFPQATDDHCVYSYNIVCESESGKKEFNYFSEYYFEPMPETLTFILSNLEPETEYTVSVYPIDVFGKKGQPITSAFTTNPEEKIEYSSKNPVNYVGTFTNFDSAASLSQANNTFAYGGGIDGDVFVGDWASGSLLTESGFALTEGGFQGSKALSVWSDSSDNQGLYIFATEENGNVTAYPSAKYLRVWVDFTNVDFRKANFGLVSPTGNLYTTDESDYAPELYFYYMAEGTDSWVQYSHGGDGCFGTEQASSVKNFKGWLAFPVKDFTYRGGTGNGTGTAGESYPLNEIAGVYMFWDYSNDSLIGNKFLLDEIQLVEDYTVFEEYGE